MSVRMIFDPDPAAVAPETAPEVWVVPAEFGCTPGSADAIIDASPQVELFDEEEWRVPKLGFRPIVAPAADNVEELINTLNDARARAALPLILGGGHECLLSISAFGAGVSIL
ncbi:MAG: hypothetical protein AAF986_06285, partial [Pseudomonadota bacterium]